MVQLSKPFDSSVRLLSYLRKIMRQIARNLPEKVQEINPFSHSLRIETHYSTVKSRIKGDTIGIVTQSVITLRETEEYTQLYHTHTLAIFKELDNNAKLLFMWVAIHIQWTSQKIELRQERVCEECNFSKATFYRAIDGLIKFAVIQKSTARDKTYWFNPMLFFRGKRMDAFPTCVVAPSCE